MSLPRGVSGLRPTAARIRGAIFDRLAGAIEGAQVLDLFAGSGALSFEALSRGAERATLVEVDARVVRHLKTQTEALGLRERIAIVRADAIRFLRTTEPRPYDLVLVDPPFATPEVFEPIAQALVRGWLAADASVVCERELVRGQHPVVAWPPGLELRLARTYGQALVEFLEAVPLSRSRSSFIVPPPSGVPHVSQALAISKRAAAIKPSATLAVSGRAAELRAAGKQVLNFSAGEPDFKPPTAVRSAVAAMSEREAMHYTAVPGTPQLRDAVAHELGQVHGRSFERGEILISCGAKHSLANLFLATLDPGDEVVIPAPYWVSYPDMVGLAEGESVIVPSTREAGWRMTPEALEAALGPRTRFVILNSPSNPTGAGYRAEDLRALGEVMVRKAPAAYLVVDDIYRQLVYGDYVHASAFKAWDGLSEQIIVVDGVSKTYAMTGHRIGFLAGPKNVISAASSIQSQTTSGPATLSQHAALVALTDPSVKEDVAAMHEAFTRRRRLMLDGLADAPGLEVLPPDGAFYVFVDVSRHVGQGARHADDVELATWLLEEKLVGTVPGTPFGAPGHLRLSYATSDEIIREGCERIAAALSSLPTA